jgi:hypothetical protein
MAVNGVKSNAAACLDILVNKEKERKDEETKQAGGAGTFSSLIASLLQNATPSVAVSKADGASASGSASSASERAAATQTSQEAAGDTYSLFDFSTYILDHLKDPEVAGKSIDELAKGLGRDFANYADEATKIFKEAGVPYVVFGAVGTMIAFSPGIKLTQMTSEEFGNFDTVKVRTDYLNAEMRKRQTPEYQAMIKEREETYWRLAAEQRESGEADRLRQDFERLAARSALVKAGETIEGFKEQYAADPEGTVKKYSTELSELVQSVNVKMDNGAITYSY